MEIAALEAFRDLSVSLGKFAVEWKAKCEAHEALQDKLYKESPEAFGEYVEKLSLLAQELESVEDFNDTDKAVDYLFQRLLKMAS